MYFVFISMMLIVLLLGFFSARATPKRSAARGPTAFERRAQMALRRAETQQRVADRGAALELMERGLGLTFAKDLRPFRPFSDLFLRVS